MNSHYKNTNSGFISLVEKQKKVTSPIKSFTSGTNNNFKHSFIRNPKMSNVNDFKDSFNIKTSYDNCSPESYTEKFVREEATLNEKIRLFKVSHIPLNNRNQLSLRTL